MSATGHGRPRRLDRRLIATLGAVGASLGLLAGLLELTIGPSRLIGRARYIAQCIFERGARFSALRGGSRANRAGRRAHIL